MINLINRNDSDEINLKLQWNEVLGQIYNKRI